MRSTASRYGVRHGRTSAGSRKPRVGTPLSTSRSTGQVSRCTVHKARRQGAGRSGSTTRAAPISRYDFASKIVGPVVLGRAAREQRKPPELETPSGGAVLSPASSPGLVCQSGGEAAISAPGRRRRHALAGSPRVRAPADALSRVSKNASAARGHCCGHQHRSARDLARRAPTGVGNANTPHLSFHVKDDVDLNEFAIQLEEESRRRGINVICNRIIHVNSHEERRQVALKYCANVMWNEPNYFVEGYSDAEFGDFHGWSLFYAKGPNNETAGV